MNKKYRLIKEALKEVLMEDFAIEEPYGSFKYAPITSSIDIEKIKKDLAKFWGGQGPEYKLDIPELMRLIEKSGLDDINIINLARENKIKIDYRVDNLYEAKEAFVLKEGFEPGTFVLVKPTASGLQASYPAAKWLTKEMVVKLLDYAPFDGTLDVLDVELADGTEESVYDFNIVKKARVR